jgi:hypothetical protein
VCITGPNGSPGSSVAPTRAPSAKPTGPTRGPTRAPTTAALPNGGVDCTVSCALKTGSTCSAVTCNNLVTDLLLPKFFTLSFEYKNPTMRSSPAMSNILDLVDGTTAQSLLSVSMPWANNMALGYGGDIIDMWGPQLVSNYASAYTKITVVVQAGAVSITSSNNPAWVQSVWVPANIDTTSNYYHLYLSNNNVGSDTYSAEGCIRNVFINSKSPFSPSSPKPSLADLHCLFILYVRLSFYPHSSPLCRH